LLIEEFSLLPQLLFEGGVLAPLQETQKSLLLNVHYFNEDLDVSGNEHIDFLLVYLGKHQEEVLFLKLIPILYNLPHVVSDEV